MSNLDLRAAQETESLEQMVKDLLLGAEVLDRKKAETKRLVNGLIGLLRARKHTQQFCVLDRWFESERFAWNVQENRPGHIRVTGYFGRIDGGSAGVFRPVDLVYDSTRTGDHTPLEWIDEIHAHLGLLLHGLLVSYPHLIMLIQPVLAAARTAKI